MKPQLNLSIPRPCSQPWQTFTETASGGFCSTCQKTVVDFTIMSDEAIHNYFKSKPVHACGRFRRDQLKSYTIAGPTTVQPGWRLVRAALVSLLVLLINRQTPAQTSGTKTKIEHVEQSAVHPGSTNTQEHVVKGIVKDEYKDPMPGVNVVLKGAPVGICTDAEGKFTFPQKLKEGDVLVFSFIGYAPEEYVIRKDVSEVITIQCKLDADITGEVVVDEVYTAKRGFRRWWSKVQNIF